MMLILVSRGEGFLCEMPKNCSERVVARSKMLVVSFKKKTSFACLFGLLRMQCHPVKLCRVTVFVRLKRSCSTKHWCGTARSSRNILFTLSCYHFNEYPEPEADTIAQRPCMFSWVCPSYSMPRFSLVSVNEAEGL